MKRLFLATCFSLVVALPACGRGGRWQAQSVLSADKAIRVMNASVTVSGNSIKVSGTVYNDRLGMLTVDKSRIMLVLPDGQSVPPFVSKPEKALVMLKPHKSSTIRMEFLTNFVWSPGIEAKVNWSPAFSFEGLPVKVPMMLVTPKSNFEPVAIESEEAAPPAGPPPTVMAPVATTTAPPEPPPP